MKHIEELKTVFDAVVGAGKALDIDFFSSGCFSDVVSADDNEVATFSLRGFVVVPYGEEHFTVIHPRGDFDYEMTTSIIGAYRVARFLVGIILYCG